MVAKARKRSIVYTDEASKQVIEGILGDESSINNTSFSFAMESHILTNILTRNKIVNYWIQCLYMPEYTIGDIFSMIFEFNSVGIYGETQQLPLLDILNHLRYWDSLTDSAVVEAEVSEIVNNMNYLIEFCEGKCKNDKTLKEEYQNIIASIEFIKNELDKKNSIIRSNDFYTLVAQKWNLLNNSTYTFRVLKGYVGLKTNYVNTSELRYQFVNYLRDLAENWDLR